MWPQERNYWAIIRPQGDDQWRRGQLDASPLPLRTPHTATDISAPRPVRARNNISLLTPGPAFWQLYRKLSAATYCDRIYVFDKEEK